MQAALEGKSSLDEVLRVTHNEDAESTQRPHAGKPAPDGDRAAQRRPLTRPAPAGREAA